MKYEHIFTPGQIGPVNVRNRIVMSPMDDALGQASGEVTQRGIEYYAAKAKGGTGLIIVGYVGYIGAELCGTAMSGQTFLMNLDQRHAMTNLVERVHEYGGKVFIQLNHAGRKTSPEFNNGAQPVSASAITPDLEKRGFAPVHELTKEEILRLEDAIATAAEHAYMAKADGVELHCAHYYLFNQFLSESRNVRTDEYGGSIENRCRIVVETIEKIREKCPRSFAVTARIHLFDGEGMEHENSIEDMIEIAKYLESKGVQGFNFSIGTGDRTGSPEMLAGWRNEYYKQFKAALNVPIYGPNETKTPDEAEAILADDVMDFIVMGRQHNADPEWCNKAKFGHEDDIRPCLSCNWCLYRVTADQSPIRCAVNPLTAREVDNLVPMSKGEGTVCVIGAGPGGVQAALTLSERGFKVRLYEKDCEIGGALNAANKPPHKFRIENYRQWMIRQVEKDSNIELFLNTEVTNEMLDEWQKEGIYGVIYAGGGLPVIPKAIPGIDKAYESREVLAGTFDDKLKDKRVAVIGGGMTGLETALYLADRGNKITLVEMLPIIGNNIFVYNARKLREELEENDAVIKVNTQLLEVKDDAISVQPCKVHYIGTALAGAKNIAGQAKVDKEEEHNGPYDIPVDACVISLGLRPNLGIMDTLYKKFDHVTSIGECNQLGNIGTATSEGFLAAKNF